ncbi:MAG: hypothetical protein QOH67_1276 [Hyphomicrobiales bacterium]|nr:hypothetical protein [Hyphomicrobiales bacterium]
MICGVPDDGVVGLLTPAEELVPELVPMLPVVPAEPDPTVPVTGAGIPALPVPVPVPVPKFGVTVVLPGPLPPGTPAPEDGTCEGVPGCPGPDEVAVPGDVLPAAPPDAPPPAPP